MTDPVPARSRPGVLLTGVWRAGDTALTRQASTAGRSRDGARVWGRVGGNSSMRRVGRSVPVTGLAALAFAALASATAGADPGSAAPAKPAVRPSGTAVPVGSSAPRVSHTLPASRPTNLLCPVMTGTPVDAAFTSVFEGKVVAFSSADAKQRFDAHPSGFSRNLTLESLDLFDTEPMVVVARS